MPICPKCHQTGPSVGTACERDGYHFVEEQALRAVGNDELLGASLDDRYVILERLAQGGMGAIYRALQQPVGRAVAVKVLLAEVERSNTGRRRFIREARAISKLSHPNIITLHDFGFDEQNRPFMVMEYASGQSVGSWLKTTDLTTDHLLHVSRQILSALTEAHHQGIVHRDLKPANVMITRAGHDEDFAKLLDFGLARLIQGETMLTRDDEVFGTPHYMSPEQARSSKEVGPSSDVYSMGIMMYRFFCGRVPFHADRPLQVLFKHINEPLPQIRPRDEIAVPGAIGEVIRRATLKEPDQRYADAGAMLDALEAAVAQTDTGAFRRQRRRSPTPRPVSPPDFEDGEPTVSYDGHPTAELDATLQRAGQAPTLAMASPVADEYEENVPAPSSNPPSSGDVASATEGDTQRAWESATEPVDAPENHEDTKQQFKGVRSPTSTAETPKAEEDRSGARRGETDSFDEADDTDVSTFATVVLLIAAAVAGAAFILVIDAGDPDEPSATPAKIFDEAAAVEPAEDVVEEAVMLTERSDSTDQPGDNSREDGVEDVADDTAVREAAVASESEDTAGEFDGSERPVEPEVIGTGSDSVDEPGEPADEPDGEADEDGPDGIAEEEPTEDADELEEQPSVEPQRFERTVDEGPRRFERTRGE